MSQTSFQNGPAGGAKYGGRVVALKDAVTDTVRLVHLDSINLTQPVTVYEDLDGADRPKNLKMQAIARTGSATATALAGFKIAPGQVFNLELGVQPVAATVAIGDMTLRARQLGRFGNDLEVHVVKPNANNAPLTVTLQENALLVHISLATDNAGVATTTNSVLAAALQNHPLISQVVSVAAAGAVNGLVPEVARKYFAGGTSDQFVIGQIQDNATSGQANKITFDVRELAYPQELTW